MNDLFRIGLCALGLLFFYKTAEGQEKLLLGLVLDSASSAPLVGAQVTEGGANTGVVTDATGRFRLPWDRTSPVSLRISHMGHRTLDRTVRPSEMGTREVLVFRMAPEVFVLPEAIVRKALPEVVYQRADLHVGAYFANDDGLWVLVYESPKLWHRQDRAGEQVLRGARLHLLDTLFQERHVLTLPTSARALLHDHRQRVIVEGMDEAWLALKGEDGIELERIDRTALHEAVLPWTDSIPGYLLGNNLSPTYPAFDHIAYDPRTDAARLICAVQDEHLMDLFRSQYKYMSGHDKVVAMDLEKELGVDREVIAGYMTAFYKDPYFDVPYAPLFVVNDTLCVFDHYRERIRRFTPDLAAVDEVSMSHHTERNWKTRLLQDAVDGRIYAMYAKGIHTWLREVDPMSGALGRVISLTHPFPEEVQVRAGHAYYVYRPYGSLQHRTLYRESLR